MAEVTPADPAAEAKTRARRTLIGSAILALTAVVVVPLVMDSKPRPWSDDVTLQIPGKDTKFDTPLKVPAATPTGQTAPSAAPAKPAAAASPAAAELPKPEAAPVTSPAAKVEAPPAKEQAKPEPAKPAPAAPAPVAKPEPKAQAKPADPKAGKVVLQAGAFSTEDKVKAIEADLRKAGFSPYRETVETKNGTVTRVRFTVASSDAAAKAVSKLSAAGITPKIIPQ
jgi:DedD protein